MPAFVLTPMLAVTALILAVADHDQEWEWDWRRKQVSKPLGHWLGLLVLLAMAAASIALGIRYPEAVAAPFG